MVRRCRRLCANVRTLMMNFRDLAVAAYEADIVLLCETMVGCRRHDAELQIKGLRKAVHLRRGDVVGGQGLCCYVRKGFNAFRQRQLECACHEVQAVKICCRHTNFYVLSVYRNPHNDDSIYECLLTSMAEAQSRDAKESFVFVGDFNAHHVEWLESVSDTDVHGTAAHDFAFASGCRQLVDGPTHEAARSKIISPQTGVNEFHLWGTPQMWQ